LAAEQNINQAEIQAQPEAARDFKPRGIGTAVVFDWALAAQIVFGAVFAALGVGIGSATANISTAGRLGVALGLLGGAAGVAAFGEAMRRGVRPIWMAQIGINALLFFVGARDIPATIQSVKDGHLGLLVHTFVLLIISPVIAWMLTRKATREWIAHTTRAEARRRHGGRWLVYIITYAIISGAIIAFGPLY
jgi:uncharacterized membrane-anchored protein YitT (DUF2179 family)